MDTHLSSLIDRYLYPDQILFGHLFNHNIKAQHDYELTKSSPHESQNNQLIIYHKQMSKTKIDSMIQMMNGQHPPLFKSSVLPKTKHYQAYQNQSGQQSYQEQQEDYEDYDDQMYLMEKDYEEYFDDQYDQQENPIMAIGQNMGFLPKMKNYAPQFHYQPQTNKKHIKHHHQSQKTIHLTQPGLGAALIAAQQQKKKTQTQQQKPKKQQEQNNPNQSEQEWQTQSEQQQQSHP